MKRFLSLLKKELKELLTVQMVLPLIIGSVVFMFLGNIIGNETEKMSAPQKIYVVDSDKTAESALVISALEGSNFTITLVDIDDGIESVVDTARENEINFIVEIKEGFSEGLKKLEKQEISTYSIIKNFSLTSSVGSAKVDSAVTAINSYLSNTLIDQYTGGLDPEAVKAPVVNIDNTIVGENMAKISPGEVTNFIMSQTMFIPIIMFIIIIFSSQMIGVSIASEKENKTLETLLSTPLPRMTLVTAKMTAAAIAALIMASVYMFGFSFYMSGITGGNMQAGASSEGAIAALGLSIGTTGYILLGLSLFLSILTALAIAMILGAFAEDVKKVQGLLAPMIFLIMIPYLFSMFVDLSTASLPLRLLIYAIPFSHTFLAAPNIFLQNYGMIYAGAAYQLVVFILLALVATKIFSSDKILTLKLSFGNRKR